MARPRKTDRELLENAFYDASLEEQAAILRGERERGPQGMANDGDTA